MGLPTCTAGRGRGLEVMLSCPVPAASPPCMSPSLPGTAALGSRVPAQAEAQMGTAGGDTGSSPSGLPRCSPRFPN